MNKGWIAQRLRAAIETIDDETPEEFFADLEHAVIIDAEGRVLKRTPEPPRARRGQWNPGHVCTSRPVRPRASLRLLVFRFLHAQ